VGYGDEGTGKNTGAEPGKKAPEKAVAAGEPGCAVAVAGLPIGFVSIPPSVQGPHVTQVNPAGWKLTWLFEPMLKPLSEAALGKVLDKVIMLRLGLDVGAVSQVSQEK